MQNLDNIFFALSDPTRRDVLERIRNGPMPAGKIAEGLPVTRPAVSQHLRILKDAELIQERREGTKRIYGLNPLGLEALKEFFDDYWSVAMTRFKDFVETEEP